MSLQTPPKIRTLQRRLYSKANAELDYLPAAVARMVKLSGISPRQAYRYLHRAQFLAKPVPVGDRKVAFTVKLSRELVQRLRAFANRTDLSLSEIVSRALHAALPLRRRRG